MVGDLSEREVTFLNTVRVFGKWANKNPDEVHEAFLGYLKYANAVFDAKEALDEHNELAEKKKRVADKQLDKPQASLAEKGRVASAAFAAQDPDLREKVDAARDAVESLEALGNKNASAVREDWNTEKDLAAKVARADREATKAYKAVVSLAAYYKKLLSNNSTKGHARRCGLEKSNVIDMNPYCDWDEGLSEDEFLQDCKEKVLNAMLLDVVSVDADTLLDLVEKGSTEYEEYWGEICDHWELDKKGKPLAGKEEPIQKPSEMEKSKSAVEHPDEGKPGYVTNPIDISDYMFKSKAVDAAPCDVGMTMDILEGMLTAQKSRIRWTRPLTKKGKPHPQRKLIHRGDWAAAMELLRTRDIDGEESHEDVQRRMDEVRKTKQSKW